MLLLPPTTTRPDNLFPAAPHCRSRDGVVRRMQPAAGTVGGKPAGHVLHPCGVGTEQIDVVRRFAGHDGANEPAAEEQLAVVKLQQIPHVARKSLRDEPKIVRRQFEQGHSQPSFFESLTTTGLISTVRATSIRSEEHTSELQSLMRRSYAVFCLQKQT